MKDANLWSGLAWFLLAVGICVFVFEGSPDLSDLIRARIATCE